MPKFILVRHGESVWNSQRRIQGSLDPELSPRGRRQTDLLGTSREGRLVQKQLFDRCVRAGELRACRGRAGAGEDPRRESET